MGHRMNLLAHVLLGTTLALTTNTSIEAQDQQHVVSPADLRNDLAKAAETRHRNEADVRALFNSQEGKQALKSAHLDYRKVDRAIAQLSDEDARRLAQRSRQVQADFAAGRISSGYIVLIVAIIAAAIILAVVFEQLNHS